MKTYIKILTTSFLLLLTISAYSQVVVTDDGSPEVADGSAVFELQSTEKGFLVPKMTTAQRDAIVDAATGLLVFDVTLSEFYFYNGSAWINSGSNWLGSTTRIKILPKDFVGTIETGKKGEIKAVSDYAYFDVTDDAITGYGVVSTEDNLSLVSFITIPTGYSATEVIIYGSDTTAKFNVAVGHINTPDDAITVIGAPTDIGSLMDITDTPSTPTNYLIIYVSVANGFEDLLYGGYVSISPN